MEEETLHSSTPIFRPAAPGRRTPSFSSSNSSSLSFTEEFYQFSPISTNNPLKFKGVPFSWEQIPGIPKHRQVGGGGSHMIKNGEYSTTEHLLPLPPNSSGKKLGLHHQEEISPKKSNRFQRDDDPFYAALVECSKDDDSSISKNITRSLSDRFGFINMYTSCKRSCNVSESIVYLPSRQPSPHYLLNRRSS
ncbi:hypothetical protein ACP275_03G118100 [Erythranthe tilingii]